MRRKRRRCAMRWWSANGVVALHAMGIDHVWGYVPWLMVGALVVFVGAGAVRTKLEQWAHRDDPSEPDDSQDER